MSGRVWTGYARGQIRKVVMKFSGSTKTGLAELLVTSQEEVLYAINVRKIKEYAP